MTKKPVIGITGPDKGGKAAWFFTALSVFLAGGTPLRIRPGRPRTIDKIDGLIIGGGSDLDPDTYRKEKFVDEYLQKTIKDKRKSKWRRIADFFKLAYYPIIFTIRILFSRESAKLDKNRDGLEFNLLDKAIHKKIPVLGICRGAQLINVYFKGSLYEDINTFYFEEPNRYSIFPVKKIHVKPNSTLASILGVDKLTVNALHHQAVKKAGEDVEIVAKERNNVVQGIESEAESFIIGVQWHPEYLVQQKRQRKIFEALVEQAKKKLS